MAGRVTEIREKRFQVLAMQLQFVAFRKHILKGALFFIHFVCLA